MKMVHQTNIPWFDLSRQYQGLREEILAAVDDLMGRGNFILGPSVTEFEQNFAAWIGSKHCIGLNSGTSALHLALRVLEIGAGDEVITSPATWISTVWAISYVGAKPVFVDIDPETYCLDPNLIEETLTPRTKAILPVHLYGQCADMPVILNIARRNKLAVIEDACQAHGARFLQKPAGTFGQIGCFSFYPGKNLGAYGEAGALVTDDDYIAERVRSLRNHAQTQRNLHTEIGYNMRMEGLQGAILNLKLRYLSQWLEARRKIALQYSAAWDGLAGLTIQREADEVTHAWHIYSLRVKDRENFRSFLAGQGIQTSVHYPTPVHLQPAYRHLGYQPGDFPVAEALCRSQVTMPLFPEMTKDEIDQVVDAVQSWTLSWNEQQEKFAA